MKAVVLVGGEGTRMRPLTETTPKPLIPLVDRPGLDHVLDHLARHGVHEVVLSSPYLERTFHPFIAARHGDPGITWITETEPLGTGGAVVNALAALGDEPFFALNGDILTDLDLTAMLAFHRDRDAAVTIALHRAEDARAFGLIEHDDDGRVRAFLEKPQEAVAGDVNAGTYLLDPAVLRSWTADSPISIEREIFPDVIAGGNAVFGFAGECYWMDLGTPEKYLEAHRDMLAGRVRGLSYEAPWIAPTADVEDGASIDEASAVGAEARIAPGATIERSVIHPGSSVAVGAVVTDSIVGPGAHVGAGAKVTGSVLGAGSRVPEGMHIAGAKVPTDTVASAT
jgi:NDP-sugar pyrophosphorylase family protein